MFKILDEVCTPKRATKYSAYVDLFAREDCVIGAGETKIVKLGVKIDLEKLENQLIFNVCLRDVKAGFPPLSKKAKKEIFEEFLNQNYLEVALRSSLAVKGLIIANGIGVIDLDYPDEIGLIVHNPQDFRWFKDDLENIDIIENDAFFINKGDKVAQCTLKGHKGYLMGYESDVIRNGGFGSTGGVR